MSPNILRLRVPLVPDPLAAYSALCADRDHTLLLESADPSAGNANQSVVVADAALRVVARGLDVEVEAFTENGQGVLGSLHDLLQTEHGLPADLDGDTLRVAVPTPGPDIDEEERLKAKTPLTILRALSSLVGGDEPLAGLLAGLFGFELALTLEGIPVPDGEGTVPDICMYLAETLLHIDHRRSAATLIGVAFTDDDSNSYYEISRRLATYKEALASRPGVPDLPPPTTPDSAEVTVTPDDGDFARIVTDLKENILAGDCFQVVPSRRFQVPCPDPGRAYQALRRINPSPFMFYMAAGSFTLFGASPEAAVEVDGETREVAISPIAGTRRRGDDPDADARIELELRRDPKEQAEHMMLVDLARNDVARVSRPGTRAVVELLRVDRYSSVMHLVSRVTGLLREDLDALHAYQAAANMGTLSGAPKIRAMELIASAEGIRRGAYGGAIGYLSGTGDLNTAIVIRSAVVIDGQACVQAGAGIVYDSDPLAETEETRAKAEPVLQAISSTIPVAV